VLNTPSNNHGSVNERYRYSRFRDAIFFILGLTVFGIGEKACQQCADFTDSIKLNLSKIADATADGTDATVGSQYPKEPSTDSSENQHDWGNADCFYLFPPSDQNCQPPLTDEEIIEKADQLNEQARETAIQEIIAKYCVENAVDRATIGSTIFHYGPMTPILSVNVKGRWYFYMAESPENHKIKVFLEEKPHCNTDEGESEGGEEGPPDEEISQSVEQGGGYELLDKIDLGQLAETVRLAGLEGSHGGYLDIMRDAKQKLNKENAEKDPSGNKIALCELILRLDRMNADQIALNYDEWNDPLRGRVMQLSDDIEHFEVLLKELGYSQEINDDCEKVIIDSHMPGDLQGEGAEAKEELLRQIRRSEQ